MTEMKLAALGEQNAVLGLRAVGFDVEFADQPEEAAHKLRRLVKSGEYAAIFLTEDLMESLSDLLAEYRDLTLPAIIAIPTAAGTTGYGVANIKKSVERAVGADILFKEQR